MQVSSSWVRAWAALYSRTRCTRVLAFVTLTVGCTARSVEPEPERKTSTALATVGEASEPSAEATELVVLRRQKQIALVESHGFEREHREVDGGDGPESVDVLVATVRVLEPWRGSFEDEIQVAQVDSFHAVNLEEGARALLGLSEVGDRSYWVTTSSGVQGELVSDLGVNTEVARKLLQEAP